MRTMSKKPRPTEKQVAAAKERCRKAWLKHPDAGWAWCCHHMIRVERLEESPAKRIDYIYNFKDWHQLVTRYDNFRPVVGELPKEFLKEYTRCFGPGNYTDDIWIETRMKKYPSIVRQHRKEVPRHTFKKGSIFGK